MAGVSFKRSNRHPHYPGLGGTFSLETKRSRIGYCRGRARGSDFARGRENLRFWAGIWPRRVIGGERELS